MVQTSIAAWLFKKTTTTTGEPANSDAATKGQRLESQATESQTSSSLPPGEPSSDHSPLNSSIARPTDAASLQRPARSLSPNVSIEPITASNITSFHRLTALLLPIPYPPSFYTETLENPVIASLSLVVIWHDTPTNPKDQPSSPHPAPRSQLVSAIRCRLLSRPPDQPASVEDTPILYISTITTLAPFRRHALGTHLLRGVAATAAHAYGATAIMAHVWEANDEAMEWYARRGFRVVAKIDGYYARLAPRTGAWLVRRDISMLEVLDWMDER